MLSRYLQIFYCILICVFSSNTFAEMTIENLIFDDSKPFHLKILDTLPNEAIIQIGANDAKNTIIEFMDYFCGYCKKIHPELVELANERNDVRVIFLQHPILSESSKVIAKMVIAANYQQKGFELHHAIFSIEGSITQEKLNQAIKDSGVNSIKLRIDSSKDEMEKIIALSSFLAGGIGARGTPSIFVNEIFRPGYISKEQIINMLK